MSAKIVNLDSEQAAILQDAAETSIRMLNYRMERADPDGIISASTKLQKIKIDQVMRQLKLPAIPAWTEMLPERRESITKLCELLSVEPDEKIQSFLFEKLFIQVMSSRDDALINPGAPDGELSLDQEPQAPKNARKGAG